MGRSGKSSNKGGKSKAGVKTEPRFLKKVPWADRISKWSLRPYVDQVGCPYSSGRSGVDEKQLLSCQHLADVADETCSEYCSRQGVALSEGAANFEVGLLMMKELFSKDTAEGMQKSGIKACVDLLEAPHADKFLEACRYLNTAHEESRTEEATVRAVKHFLRFLTHDVSTKEAAFKKLARTAGRMLLFAWEGLEATAVVNNPRTMTASLHRVAGSGTLPQETKTWLKSPDDETAMLYSFAAAFHQQKLMAASSREPGDEGYFGGWDEEVGTETTAAGRGGGWTGGWADSDDEGHKGKGMGRGAGVLSMLKTAGTFSKKTAKSSKRGSAFDSDDEDSKSKKQKKVELDLDPEDEEEVKKTKEREDRLCELWPETSVEEFKRLVVAMAETKGRPEYSQFKAELAKLPGEHADSWGLAHVREQLLKQTKYPKASSVPDLQNHLLNLVNDAEECHAAVKSRAT